MDRTIVYRLPAPGLPRVLVTSDYGLRRAHVTFRDSVALAVESAEGLVRGATAELPGLGTLSLQAQDGELALTLDGRAVRREDELCAPVSHSAWVHAWIALLGSLFGFIASALYVARARAQADPWAMKMALHMAGWHLLLTLTLFPASVLGQRPGIRAVQAVSALFFAIHVGLALANAQAEGPWIACLNALSGFAFLAAAVYGQVAHRDMDPTGGA